MVVAVSKWRLPVVNATTVCVDVKHKELPKPEKGKGKPELKPEKNGPPKVNVLTSYLSPLPLRESYSPFSKLIQISFPDSL